MAEKTEQPTAKRLRDARQKGQVCKSQDVTSAAIMVTMMVFLGYYFPTCRQKIEGLMQAGFEAARLGNFDVGVSRMREIGVNVFVIVGIVPPVIAATVGFCANLVQVGFIAAFESVIPNLDKLSPSKWFKQVFSKRNLVEFIKGAVKMVLIVCVFYLSVKSHLGEIAAMPAIGFEAVLSVSLGGESSLSYVSTIASAGRGEQFHSLTDFKQ